MTPLLSPEVLAQIVEEYTRDVMSHRRRVAFGDLSCGGPERCGKCRTVMRIETALQRQDGDTN